MPRWDSCHQPASLSALTAGAWPWAPPVRGAGCRYRHEVLQSQAPKSRIKIYLGKMVVGLGRCNLSVGAPHVRMSLCALVL